MIDDNMARLNSPTEILAVKKIDPTKEISVTVFFFSFYYQRLKAEEHKRALYLQHQINQQGIFDKKYNIQNHQNPGNLRSITDRSYKPPFYVKHISKKTIKR